MAMIWRRPFGFQPPVNQSPALPGPPNGGPLTGLQVSAEGTPGPDPVTMPETAARPNGLQAFKKGGLVKKTGPALLHKGERVLSRSQNRRFTKAHPAIQKSHRGRLHAALGVASGKKLSIAAIHGAMNSSDPHMRKMGNFANNARSWGKK